jgi:serine/threonine protein kinase
MADDEIHFPTGFCMKDLVSYGHTGMVLLDSSTDTVIKTPHDEDRSQSMTVEQQIYERFVEHGGHKGILIYHGPFESGIRLEYAPNGNLRSYLEDHPVDEKRKIRWAVQIAEALDFAHQRGVIHGDVTGANVLLDGRLDAKLADFAGSSLDGSPLLIGVTASHEYPGPLQSAEADIFALGCTLYELMAESRPYAGLSDKVIEERYKRGQFPETKSLGDVGGIITKCWRGEYRECKQAVQDLQGEIFLILVSPATTILETTNTSKAARLRILTSSQPHTEFPSTSTVMVVAAVVAVAVSALIRLRQPRSHRPS